MTRLRARRDGGTAGEHAASPPPRPRMLLGDRQVADLQLTLDGVELPWCRLGGTLADVTATGSAGPDGEVELDVTPELADAAVAAGGALLCDREQTPIAVLVHPYRPDPAKDTSGAAVVRGRVTAGRAREAGLAAELSRSARGLSDGPSRVVVLLRPPMAGELAVTAAEDRWQLVLVPAETPTPDGVPPAVLLKSAQLVVELEAPDAAVVPIAFTWRDEASDTALVTRIARSYGDPAPRVIGADDRWRSLLEQLDAGGPVTAARSDDPAVELLRRWRPPRAQRGLVVLLTGLSGSGKSTVARDLAERITSTNDRTVSLLDGDDVRRLLSSGLGFDRAGRDLNVRRIGFVAAEVARHGGIAICAPIAPYADSRAAVREMVRPVGDFVLVHVSTPLGVCEERDLKGLYARARAGEMREFTGVSDPYEPPDDADVVIDTSALTRQQARDVVVDHLVSSGWLRARCTT